MRITLETTVYSPTYAKKVVIEVPYDDIDITAMFEEIKLALIAYGFSEKQVNKLK